MILIFISIVLCELSYTLSTDRKIFTVYGELEPVTLQIVRDSKVYTHYQYAIISEGITGISGSAFTECSSLENVSISSTVTYIGSYAFYQCSSLKEVYCPSGIRELGDACFGLCSNLRKISLPSSLEKVGLLVIVDTNSVESIEVRVKNIYSSECNNTLLVKNGNELITTSTADKVIKIPKTIEIIAQNCFDRYRKLEQIIFEENSNLREVNYYAFYATAIKSIIFPPNTQILGDSLFVSSKIEEISLPNSLTEVHPDVFSGCSYLKRVNLTAGCKCLESDANGIIYLKGKVSMIFIPPNITSMHIDKKTTTIGENVLQSRQKLHSLTIDSDHPKWFVVKNILYSRNPVILEAAPGAITEAEVIANCTMLNNSAFSLTKLKSIKFLGDKVTVIGNATFGRCWSLSDFTFPQRMKELGSWSLQNTAIKSLEFPSTTEIIRNSFAANSQIEEIILSKCNSLTTIHSDCFRYAPNLKHVYLPNSLKTINTQAFIQLAKLEEISIPSSVTSISSKAFFGSSLKTLIFEGKSSLTTIGSFCFASTNLSEVKLPQSISTLDENCFSGCMNLTILEIDPQSKITTFTPFFINSTQLIEIQISVNTQTIMECAFSGCHTLEQILVPNGNTKFTSVNGYLYSNRNTVFVAFPPGLRNVTFIDTTTSIAGSAFFECVKLVDVLFGQSDISEIGPSTFYGCSSLTTIKFPDSMTVLQPKCFSGCKNLHQIFFSPNSQIGSIGKQSFSSCSSLKYFDARNCSQLKTLGEESFSSCTNLESVFLPPNFENILSKCFSDCTLLQSVIFCPSSYSNSYSGSDVFSGCNSDLRVWVTPLYTYETFLNVPVAHILDMDCHIGTSQFTVQKSNSAKIYWFVSCLDEGDTNLE